MWHSVYKSAVASATLQTGSIGLKKLRLLTMYRTCDVAITWLVFAFYYTSKHNSTNNITDAQQVAGGNDYRS